MNITRRIGGILLLTAFSCLILSGCGQAYRLSASGWGTQLSEAEALLRTAGEDIEKYKSKVVTDATIKQRVLDKLNQAENILTTLRSELPETGPDHHATLLSGIDELLTAIDSAKGGIAERNATKVRAFGKQAEAAGAKLQEWGDIVRNNG